MHELSIVSTLVESVLEFVDKHEISKVLNVRLSVGELTCVEEEQMQFCYSALTEKTMLGGSVLEIEKVSAEVNCPHCMYQGAPKYWEDALCQAPIPTLQCPNCGKAADAARGHECTIKTIKYVT